jgi:ABC-type xylose transport system permease subunit
MARWLNKDMFRNSTLLFVVAAIWIFFQVMTEGTFLTQRNLVLLALQTSIVSLAAISAVMLIVTRNFDLSVGSAVALVGVVLAVLTVKHDVPPALAVGAALAAGVAMGAWQGLWVTRMGVSSFIVTLAGMLYFRGLSMIVSDGSTIAPLPDALADLATGFLAPAPAITLLVLAVAALAGFQVMGARRARALGVIERVGPTVARTLAPFVVGAGAFAWLASRQGIPYLVLLVATAAIVAEIVMRRTPFGVQLYAIGGNPEAARLSGIRLHRVVFIDFLIAGLAYGVTGVALTARVGGAVGGSAGLFLELDAISAAIIGGTSLTGGRGRVFGALVGALLMGSLNNGMSLMNVPTFYQETARGVVLLLAVAADQLRRRRQTSS